MSSWALAKTSWISGYPQGRALLSSSKSSSLLFLKKVRQNFLIDTHSMETQRVKINFSNISIRYGAVYGMRTSLGLFMVDTSG